MSWRTERRWDDENQLHDKYLVIHIKLILSRKSDGFRREGGDFCALLRMDKYLFLQIKLVVLSAL